MSESSEIRPLVEDGNVIWLPDSHERRLRRERQLRQLAEERYEDQVRRSSNRIAVTILSIALTFVAGLCIGGLL